MSNGIDYGMGTTNIDKKTGIRYGVIPQNDVLEAWGEASEPDYGPPTCGECGNEAVSIDEVPFDLDDCETLRQDGDFRKHDVLAIPKEYQEACGGNEEWHDEGGNHACLSCARSFDSQDAYGEEPLSFTLDDGEYLAEGDSDGDIFIMKSPYYTFGPFCSPCAPGAVYIRGGSEKGAKAYCFAPDWFDPLGDDDVTGEYCGEKTSCPYPVYRVADGECVFKPARKE